MTPAEAALDQRKRDQRSASMMRAARQDPRGPSSGGGSPVTRSSASTSAPVAAAPAPSAPSDAAAMGGAVDTGQPAKVYGVNAPADPLGYMGHFANDNVTAQGHNVGHKPKGVAYFKGTAMRGYRKLPGTGANQIGHARFGDAPTGLQTKQERKDQAAMSRKMQAVDIAVVAAPRGISDLKLSAKHHKESIANDKKHLREHAESIKRHEQMLKTRHKQIRGAKR